MKNKLLAVLLAAAMTVGLVTVTPFADEQKSAGVAAISETTDASQYDTSLTPEGSSFTTGGIQYRVTSMETAEVTYVDSSSNPTDVVIPSSVTYQNDSYTVTAVADGALSGLGAARNLTIPATVADIGSGSMLSSLETITLESGNQSLFLKDGVLYKKADAGNELVLYPSASASVSFVIPDGTSAVRANAFYGAKTLLTVVIPSSVSKISEGAFQHFANSLAVAFDTEKAPASVSGKAFELDAASNIFYFRNADVLQAIRNEASDFAGSSDVTYVTTGIPSYVAAIRNADSLAAVSSAAENTVLQAGEDAGIADGYYVIKSNINPSYVLDVNNGAGSPYSLSNVDIHSANGSEAQVFKVTKVDGTNNLYTFTCVDSEKVLDVSGRGTSEGTNVQQYDSNGTEAQEFKIVQTDTTGAYTIVTSYSSLVLDVSGGIAADGTNVQIWSSNASNAQKWQFQAVADPTANALAAGVYTIHTSISASGSSDYSTRAIDVAMGSKLSGANVQIYKSNGSNAQKFLFIPLGYGNYYYVLNAATRKAVDVQNGDVTAGTNVQMYTENDSDAQIWKVVLGTDGYYTMTSRKSGLSLDVSGGITENGRNVQIWDSNYSAAQKWILEKTEPASISGLYTIYSAADRNLCFDVTGGSLDDCALIQVYGSNETNAQKFILSDAGSGLFSLQNLQSGKVLDIQNGNLSNGTGLQQYFSNDTDAQKYRLVQTGDSDGSYYLQTYDGSLNVNITGNSAEVRAKLSLASPNASSATQKWYLSSTSYQDGWQIVGGRTCYVVNGSVVTNSWIGSGYLDENGQIYNGWHSAPSDNGVYKQGYYYYFDGLNGAQSDARPYINQLYPEKQNTFTYNDGDGRGTMTQTGYNCHYTIYVDRANCLVTVYTTYPGTDAVNVPIWEFKCSPGISGTDRETDAGHTTVYFKDNWFELMGPSYGQYVTLINTAGEYFHSIPGAAANDHNVDASTYNLLGTQQSHGCCRLCVRNAYWIYAFCWIGTDIYVGDNYVHPINTYYQPMMTYGQVIDPTDVHYTGNYGYTDNGAFYGFHDRY